MCTPPYSLLFNGWQSRLLFSLHSFLLQESLHFGGLQLPSSPLGLKRYFWPLWEGSIRLGHFFWPPPQWPWHTHPSSSLFSWHLLCSLFSCFFLLLGGASGPGFWSPTNSFIHPSFAPTTVPLPSIFRKLAGMTLPPTLTLTVHLQRNTRLFLFPLLLLSLPLWHWMRPNLPFLSAASNALLKPGGLLRWKVRLVKDARLSLPLIEVMKIVRLTSLLLDAPRQSLLRPRRRHGRRLALLFHLNLCILFFALSLALLSRLPPLLISQTALLPGNRLWSMPLTWDPIFPFLSQRPCVAEPEATSLSSTERCAVWSVTCPFALLSLPLNFLRLTPTFPHPLPLAQTKLPILC